MSSLADPVSPGRQRRRSITVPIPDISGSGTLATGVAIGIAAAAFAAAGGLRLERTTNVLIAMMLAGAAAVAAALLRRPRTADTPFYGGGPLLAFAVLAAFTAFSVTWSLVPGDSWVEASRTLAYLAVFAGGVALARLLPDRWAGMVVGVGAGCLLVCAWALLTKVFPAALAPDETYARLREPFALLELRRPDGGARRTADAVARGAPVRPRGGQRAGVAGARGAVRVHDALVLARRAARRSCSGSPLWFVDRAAAAAGGHGAGRRRRGRRRRWWRGRSRRTG